MYCPVLRIQGTAEYNTFGAVGYLYPVPSKTSRPPTRPGPPRRRDSSCRSTVPEMSARGQREQNGDTGGGSVARGAAQRHRAQHGGKSGLSKVAQSHSGTGAGSGLSQRESRFWVSQGGGSPPEGRGSSGGGGRGRTAPEPRSPRGLWCTCPHHHQQQIADHSTTPHYLFALEGGEKEGEKKKHLVCLEFFAQILFRRRVGHLT